MEPTAGTPEKPTFDGKRQLRQSVPVAVVLEKQIVRKAFWSEARWSLNSVLIGQNINAQQHSPKKISDSDSREQYLWSDLTLLMYRDACERYWHALIGDKPLVYVVCREDDIEESVNTTIEPAIVTLDYDEALSYVETDGRVLSTEIPTSLYLLMEKFVLQNYCPVKFKKRKRKNWSEDKTGEFSS